MNPRASPKTSSFHTMLARRSRRLTSTVMGLPQSPDLPERVFVSTASHDLS
jgi:hypothetical protein